MLEFAPATVLAIGYIVIQVESLVEIYLHLLLPE